MPAAASTALSSNASTTSRFPNATAGVPPSREVATGVVNLGNTCYMNAVLQALAHAPELCLAVDIEPHRPSCPTYQVNEERRKKRKLEEEKKIKEEDEAKKKADAEKIDWDAKNEAEKPTEKPSPPTPEPEPAKQPPAKKGRGGKKKGKKGKSPPRSNLAASTESSAPENLDDFCALCEVERHLGRVHDSTEQLSSLSSPASYAGTVAVSGGGNSTTSGEAVAPSSFVHGFIREVAPWFKLGVQEDSHEFLRLLIDAMQGSCKKAQGEVAKIELKTGEENKPVDDEDNRTKKTNPPSLSASGLTQAVPEEAKSTDENDNKVTSKKTANVEDEYSFKLFRGIVESNVKCSACKSTSQTLDPIEDIGLDVTPYHRPGPDSSRSSSPVPSSVQLADVGSALERFTLAEKLDGGYKCDTCGKLGRATKQSRLASIPPILTLHLKRFRYGSDPSGGGMGIGGIGGGARRGRGGVSTEVTALGGGTNGTAGDFGGFGGTSGSAKIEGHVKFEQIFDIRPFLTRDLQKKYNKSMFCRLFAVIVHAGKNSHSGHYIAYVRNVTKNEWWKMDDARVTRAAPQEVMGAEAYMLFYRVVDHPVAVKLRTEAKIRSDAAKKQTERERKIKLERKSVAATDKNSLSTAVTTDQPGRTSPSNSSKRKRETPKYKTAEDWAEAFIRPSDRRTDVIRILNKAEENVEENVNFTPEFFGLIKEEAEEKGGGKVGSGPSGVSPDDIQGGTEEHCLAILDVLHKLATRNGGDGKDFFLAEPASTSGGKKSGSSGGNSRAGDPSTPSLSRCLNSSSFSVPVVDTANDAFL